jgi:hypothetical protein
VKRRLRTLQQDILARGHDKFPIGWIDLNERGTRKGKCGGARPTGYRLHVDRLANTAGKMRSSEVSREADLESSKNRTVLKN